jgi:hypothetical protein
MLNRTTQPFFALLIAFFAASGAFAFASGYAEAQELEESEEEEGLVDEAPIADENTVRHGVGLRLRYILVPKALIEVFMEEASSGVGHPGFGLEYVRRKKNFEFSVGFEYDKLYPDDGAFVERGGAPEIPGTTDIVEFDNLSWLTIDAAFVYHHKLTEKLALRYGGGIGIGYVMGEIIETDANCMGSTDINDCRKQPGAAQFEEKQDFFRFPPVFNVVGGLQFTPADNFAVNFEFGMRTVFYTGLGAHYYF